MEYLLIAVGSILMGQSPEAVSGSYLLRTVNALEMSRQDIPAMSSAAEQAAERINRGGKLWAAGQPSWVSELSGRAGGIMMIRPLASQMPAPDGVVLYACEPGAKVPEELKTSGALVVVFGACDVQESSACIPNHAQAAGISPSLANAISGWLFTGEFVGALTRLGKMPVVYESIGGYGGNARIQQYKNGEIAFHEDKQVPQVAAGAIANQYVDTVCGMLRRIEKEERGKLDRAGTWAREAKANGKTLFMYSMGHLFPDEVAKTDIGKVFKSAAWNAGFRTSSAPDDAYSEGDLAVLIGYQHPAEDLLRKARPAGAYVAYVSVRSDRDFVDDVGVVWIDPMWDWLDACVFLEGYDVPLLAASGVINGAIAWEIYRLSVEG